MEQTTVIELIKNSEKLLLLQPESLLYGTDFIEFLPAEEPDGYLLVRSAVE